jgi:hypothetical protein
VITQSEQIMKRVNLKNYNGTHKSPQLFTSVVGKSNMYFGCLVVKVYNFVTGVLPTNVLLRLTCGFKVTKL